MSDKKIDAPHSGMSLPDIYYVLFRRKRLILGFSLAGILAVMAVCLIKPPQYKSEAELSLSVLEAKPISVPGEETRPMNDPSDNIIHTEIEILQSWDLAQQVVQAMTPEKILASFGGGSDSNRAAHYVKKGLTVETTPDSSVIHIAFQHPDKDVAQVALNKIIDGYFSKHFKMQGGGGVFGDFLTNETTRLRGQLVKTDNQIQQAQSEIGVITTDDTKEAYSTEITKFRGQIYSAEEELAERQAMIKVLTSSKTDTHGTSVAIVPTGQYDAYRRVCERLVVLSKKEDDYLTQQGFTEENLWVKDVRNQIADAEKIRNQLQEKYPQLGSLDIPLLTLSRVTADMSSDLHHSSAQVAELKIKIDFLHSQLNQVWSEATNFERVAATLSELQQQKESAETSLKYFTDRLERSQIDGEMFEGKASNISIIQSPTPPLREWSKQFKKILGMLAAGGIMTGLGLAFVMELYLDRSVKRPADIEIKLGLPLFISIPDVAKNGFGKPARLNSSARFLLNNASAKTANRETSTGQSLAPWDQENPLRRFYQGLRDRLIIYFEVRNVVHNPKLVAVTSCGRGAGVSSIAAGLAATLSETDDGNVLLVNISGERGAAQQFYKGELGYSLDEVLQSEKKGSLVKANLYSSVKQANGDMLPANLPKKLSALMPRLKASQYDYIIFDMPPVTPTTTTARLSGLMDMVLLVVESEKTNQDVVTGVIKLLAESKATVSTVLNKSRSYIPAKLHQEFQSYV
jgi:uncharacterized protein involved in exopolysaccharide biosynthesis/Mrp family chromosome partitioning ATPase